MLSVVDGKDRDGVHFETFSLNLLKVLALTIFYRRVLFLVDVLVLNFMAMFSAPVKVRKKDF